MERLLITGIETVVGSNLALRLAEQFEVLGLYQGEALDSENVGSAPLDAENPQALVQLARDWRPLWIIHCGANSLCSWDEPPREAASAHEPRMVRRLAELASDLSARLTVISSDVVFAGPRMFHDESSPPKSPSPRAMQVLAMEKALEGTAALVVRTHVYGWSPAESYEGFAQKALAALSGGSRIAADGRRHATPILATDLADPLVRAYALRLHGIYHLAGGERVSPYRFVLELAAACGLRMSCEGLAAPVQPSLDWHDETSLSSKRARRALAITTPLLREGLNRFSEQATNGWRQRWRRSRRGAGTHQFAA